MNIVDEIKNDISAVEALHDWLGVEGRPVDPIISEARAKICVTGNQGQSCPHNIEAHWWDRVKSSIARWIRAELEVKEMMKVATPWDAQLGMCACCGCCLSLKVHAPTRIIKEHTTEHQLGHTPSYCWMRKETERMA